MASEGTVDAKEDTGPSPAADPARDFLDFWRNYFEQTAIQTRILLESMQGGKSPEQLHNQWLGSLSQSLESFMRTPAFLEVLKQSLKRMIDLKLLQDQMAQSAAQQTGLPHGDRRHRRLRAGSQCRANHPDTACHAG